MEYFDPLKNYENRPNSESNWFAVSIIISALVIGAIVILNNNSNGPKIKKKVDF